MQRITNCILIDNEKALLLQKPSKGWWVAPGGKMENEESIAEAVKREYREETGITIYQPELVSVFTIVIKDEDQTIDEWMMFSFKTTNYEGTVFEKSPEGKLEWKPLRDIPELPMAEGDRFIFNHLEKQGVLTGTIYYTKDWKLLKYRME